MVTDPRDKDGKRLQLALHQLGRNPILRAKIIEMLIQAEPSFQVDGSVRDIITGPIVDALHSDDDEYEKRLGDGTRFKFLFRTKIARDFLMANETYLTHVWEPQTTKLLIHLTTGMRADVIVGGAYFGDQAVLVAKKIADTGGIVHCFEPNVDQVRFLQQNCALNNIGNTRVQSKGLWSQSKLKMRLDGFDSFATAIATEGGEGFETITIDDYCAEAEIQAVGLIQLDIEGAEFPALQGARGIIIRDRPHIVFEIHKEYTDWTKGLQHTEICHFLSNLGYSVFAVRDFNSHFEMPGKPVEIIPYDRVYLEGPPHGFNMVAVGDKGILSPPHFKIVTDVSPKLLLHKDPSLHHPTDGI